MSWYISELLQLLIWDLSSFKVIDVGTAGKLIRSACYGEQQVYAYLQLFLRTLDESIAVNDDFLVISLFYALFRGEPPHPVARNFVTKTRCSTLTYAENPVSI